MILLAYEIGMEEENYLFEQALNSTINFLMIISIEERLTNRGRTLTGRKKNSFSRKFDRFTTLRYRASIEREQTAAI